MTITKTKATVAGVAAASAALAGTFVFSTTTSATSAGPINSGVKTTAELNPLNNSGVTGKATVRVEGKRIKVHVKARGLAKNLPHAQHIHFGAQARHECPSVFDDANGDFRLTTTDGAPAYGPIRVSLTTRGDTSPASGLAVDRFPTAPDGSFNYDRRTKVERDVARAIRRGKAVVVVHGVDYNHNGEYDFNSAGKSELDPALPAEATDPAVCGVLKRDHHHN